VELVLRFWVANRFIETPWHILGSETLGMVRDVRPGSPYFGLVPVTPMMDGQIDNIVVYHLLEPLWTKIRKILREKLLKNKKQDWFELQLTLFILLNHVEWTMAHDIDFSNRHSLPVSRHILDFLSKLIGIPDHLFKPSFDWKGHLRSTNPAEVLPQSWNQHVLSFSCPMA
jgi:hypothetical protein